MSEIEGQSHVVDAERLLIRQRLLQAAVQIGDKLLAAREVGEHGTTWRTLNYNGKDVNRTLIWSLEEDIYSGVSGIVLFLVELFRETGREEYLSAAESGMDWVEHHVHHSEPKNFGLYTGRIGTAFAMVRLWQVTGEAEYLGRARLLARIPPEYIRECPADDLINGIAGSMLGLLHIHEAVGEPWILQAINAFCDRLIGNALHGPVGLYWGRSPQHVHGECGFAHGAGGVGFAFLELGRYFANPAFYWLAEQAFAYEDHRFDQSLANWPDFRKTFFSEQELASQKARYQAGDLEYFRTPMDFNAWCYGAAGIGLARLRAFELCGNAADRGAIRAALRKTVADEGHFGRHQTMYADPIPNPPEWVVPIAARRPEPARYESPTLCHGTAGNAELYLETYRHWKDDDLLQRAEAVAARALDNAELAGYFQPGYSERVAREDTGLFRGNAGIGYFFLRVLNPHGVPSVQALSVPGTYPGYVDAVAFPALAASRPELERRVLSRVFGRTIRVVSESHPHESDSYFSQAASDDLRAPSKRNFARWVTEEMLAALPPAELPRLADVWKLEQEASEMDDQVDSDCLLHIADRVRRERAEELLSLPQRQFEATHLIVVPGIRTRVTRWNWMTFDMVAPLGPTVPGTETVAQDSLVMLRPSAYGTLVFPLNSLSGAVIERFRGGEMVRSVTRDLVSSVELPTEEHREHVREVIQRQIRDALKFGVLTEQVPVRRQEYSAVSYPRSKA